MALTAFDSRLGISQGCVQVGEEFVFVLGDDQQGYEYELSPGDHAEVVQETDLSSIDLIRTELKINVPSDLPVGLAWEVSIIVDGSKYAQAKHASGRMRMITDLAANVSKLSGVHQVGVRLELVEV
ncbi:MAG: hypothetical protein QNJ97_26415 [Myxococcota bacterium]|nr:hypothetical protein [Myxococcota bacterium]